MKNESNIHQSLYPHLLYRYGVDSEVALIKSRIIQQAGGYPLSQYGLPPTTGPGGPMCGAQRGHYYPTQQSGVMGGPHQRGPPGYPPQQQGGQ